MHRKRFHIPLLCACHRSPTLYRFFDSKTFANARTHMYECTRAYEHEHGYIVHTHRNTHTHSHIGCHPVRCLHAYPSIHAHSLRNVGALPQGDSGANDVRDHVHHFIDGRLDHARGCNRRKVKFNERHHWRNCRMPGAPQTIAARTCDLCASVFSPQRSPYSLLIDNAFIRISLQQQSWWWWW